MSGSFTAPRGHTKRCTRWSVGLGLVGLAVAAMAISMYVNEDPIASGGNAIFMTVLGGLFLVLATYMFRRFLAWRAPN